MKRFDRILNIVLIAAVGLWIINYFAEDSLMPGDDAENVSAGEAVAADTPLPSAYAGLNQNDLRMLTESSEPDKPVMLVIYTSWCPYCKKLLPGVINIARNHSDKVDVVAISIDDSPADLKNFFGNLKPEPPFVTYNQSNPIQQRALHGFLQNHGLQFSGGIPYMAFFRNGEAVDEQRGMVPESVLLDKIDKLTNKESTS